MPNPSVDHFMLSLVPLFACPDRSAAFENAVAVSIKAYQDCFVFLLPFISITSKIASFSSGPQRSHWTFHVSIELLGRSFNILRPSFSILRASRHRSASPTNGPFSLALQGVFKIGPKVKAGQQNSPRPREIMKVNNRSPD